MSQINPRTKGSPTKRCFSCTAWQPKFLPTVTCQYLGMLVKSRGMVTPVPEYPLVIKDGWKIQWKIPSWVFQWKSQQPWWNSPCWPCPAWGWGSAETRLVVFIKVLLDLLGNGGACPTWDVAWWVHHVHLAEEIYGMIGKANKNDLRTEAEFRSLQNGCFFPSILFFHIVFLVLLTSEQDRTSMFHWFRTVKPGQTALTFCSQPCSIPKCQTWSDIV